MPSKNKTAAATKKKTTKKPVKRKPKKLTNQEYVFVMEYLKHPNGARAARVAKYDTDNPQNARFTAHALLTKPHIKRFIDDYKKELRQEVDINQNDILDLCREIIVAKPTDYEDEDGNIEVNTNSPNQRAILSLGTSTTEHITEKANGDVTTTTTTHKILKLRDPLKAAERACKLLGMDEPEKVLDNTLNININYVNKKAAAKEQQR